MSLSDIAKEIEGYAAAAVAEGEKELEAFVAKAEQVVEDAAHAVEPILLTTFSAIVAQFGPLASQVVLSLMGAAGTALGIGGLEKANLAATTIVQAAANQGVKLIEGDVSALVKNSFVAVDDIVKKALPAS